MHAPPRFTLANADRDFQDWHRGRAYFALWAVELDTAALGPRLDRVRAGLRPLLLPGYARQPHVTVQVCGFPVARPLAPGEFGPAALGAQVAALRRQPWRAPFRLEIGAPFSFSAAPCLAVADEAQALGRLRSLLQQAPATPIALDEPWPYVPHVTAGLYAVPWPWDDVRARLDALRAPPGDWSPLAQTVRSLAWMVYETRHVAGPLRTLLRIELASGRLAVPDPQALRAVFGTSSAVAGGLAPACATM